MKKKISSEKGETILETLVALLVIALSISFLSASIAKSARITDEIKKATEEGFVYSSESADDVTISVGDTPLDANSFSAHKVQWYKNEGENDENEKKYYYYYEPKRSEP